MIDLTLVTEEAAREHWTMVWGEDGPSYDELSAHQRASYKAQILPVITLIAERVEETVRALIAGEVLAIPSATAGVPFLLHRADVMNVVERR